MSLTIPALDHGQIRVFEITGDLPSGLEERRPEALLAAFGAPLNPDFIDVFQMDNLGELSLRDYLMTGYDLKADVVDQAALKGIRGAVILMMSRAANGEETALTLAPGIRHVTTIGTPATLHVVAPIQTDAASGIVPPGKAPPSDAAMGGRVAMAALLVLFALVALMVWIAR